MVEKAKCLLFDANLDKKFWAEAVNTAIYLKNRCIATGLGTPFELWTGKKPDVSHLRIFGSEAMVHVPKERRLKWDKKAKKGILVGYSEQVKGYRIYHPNSNTVVTSRDVVVMENIVEDVNVTVSCSESVSVNNEEKLVSVGEEDKSDLTASSDEDNGGAVKDASESEENIVRKSLRVPKPKKFDDFVTYMCTNSDDLKSDPITVAEALSGPDAKKWKEAMAEELKSFEDNNAWELVDAPKSAGIVKCKWVFKRKFDNENNVKFRARLVAKGFSQQQGIDFDETFSPV